MNKNILIGIALIVVAGVVFTGYRSLQERTYNNGQNPPTSADNAPPGSIHNLPLPQAVAAVRTFVAQKAGVSESNVQIVTAYEKEWSDGCLGLGGPAESCIFAITPGYEVTVRVKGVESVYRTNSDGSSIRQEK